MASPTDIVRGLVAAHAPDHVLDYLCLESGTHSGSPAYAWGYMTRGCDTQWATYESRDGAVRASFRRWYGTYLGDTDVHEERTVAVHGKTVLHTVD